MDTIETNVLCPFCGISTKQVLAKATQITKVILSCAEEGCKKDFGMSYRFWVVEIQKFELTEKHLTQVSTRPREG